MFVTMSMGQVMQMPTLRPIYVREQANKMYSPSAYFLAGWVVSTINVMFYPVITATLCFYFVDFYDQSWDNYKDWLGIMCLQALAGSSFGFMYGCVIDNEIVALLIN